MINLYQVEKELEDSEDKLNMLLRNLASKKQKAKITPIQLTLMYSQQDQLAQYIHILKRRIEEFKDER